ncbi:MAG: hypothetical protein IJM46_12630 [Oscillospiraceae bacterium]|nr:hypothetical protein [Oscillospiraceae bacterium]
METYFDIRSQTHSEKVQHLLNRSRYPYHVTRFTSADGCIYRFRVTAPQQEIYALLTHSGIPWQPSEQPAAP